MFILTALALIAQQPARPDRDVPQTSGKRPSSKPLPLATLDDGLEIDGEAVDGRDVRARLSVPVLVESRGPYHFVVDSGADRSVVSSRVAAELGLEKAGTLRLHGLGGIETVAAAHVGSISIGRSTLRDFTAPVLPGRFIGADGMLGIDALVDQRVRLDFDKNAMVVEDAKRPEAARNGDIVVTARRSRGQLILAEASTGRTGLLAVIDSGAEVTVGNNALRAAVLRGRHPPEVTPVRLTGVTGQSFLADVLTVPEVTIGGLRIHDVQVAFADVPPFAMFGLDDRPALLLGNDVLRAFRRVSLDFRRRRVRFTLR